MSDGSLKNETASTEDNTKTLIKTVKELFVKRDKHEYSDAENVESIRKKILQHAHRGDRKKIIKRLLNPTIEDITELYPSSASEESGESVIDKESIVPFPPGKKLEPELTLIPDGQHKISRNKTVTILRNVGEVIQNSAQTKNNAEFSLHPSKEVLEKHCQKDILHPVPKISKRIRSLSVSKSKSDMHTHSGSDHKRAGKETSSLDDFPYKFSHKSKNNNNNATKNSMSRCSPFNYDKEMDKESFPLLQNTQMLAPFFDHRGKELTPVFEISDGPDYFETLKIVESEKRHQKKYYKTLVTKGLTKFLVQNETDGKIKNQQDSNKDIPLIPKLLRRKSLESTGFLPIDRHDSNTAKEILLKSVRKTRQTISYKQADLISTLAQETPETSQDVSDQNSETEIATNCNTDINIIQKEKEESDTEKEKVQRISTANIIIPVAASNLEQMTNVSSKSNPRMCDAKISDSIPTDGASSFEIIRPATATDSNKLSTKSFIIPSSLAEAQTKDSSSRKSDISSPARLESFTGNVKSRKEEQDSPNVILSTSEEDSQSLSLAFTPTAMKKSRSETSESIQLDEVEIRPESVHKMLTLQQEILGLPSKYNDENRYGAFDLVKLNYFGMEKYLRYQVFHHLKREQRERRQERRKTRAGEPSVSLSNSDSDQQDEQEERMMMMVKRSGSHSSSCSLFPTTTGTGTGNGAPTNKLTFGLSICDHMKACFQHKMLKPNWLVGFCWRKKSAVAPETTSKSQKLSSQFQSCSSADSNSVDGNNKDADDDDGDDNEDDDDEDSTMSRSTNRRRKELQSMIEGREVTDSSDSRTYDSESESDTLSLSTLAEPKEETAATSTGRKIKSKSLQVSKSHTSSSLPRNHNQNKNEDETGSNLQEEFFNHVSSSSPPSTTSASVEKENFSRSMEKIQSSKNAPHSAKKNVQPVDMDK